MYPSVGGRATALTRGARTFLPRRRMSALGIARAGGPMDVNISLQAWHLIIPIAILGAFSLLGALGD